MKYKILYWIILITSIIISCIIASIIVSIVPLYILAGLALAQFFYDEYKRIKSEIKEHDIVTLINDLDTPQIKAGETGTVIHIFPNAKAYEVEFTNVRNTCVTLKRNGKIRRQRH